MKHFIKLYPGDLPCPIYVTLEGDVKWVNTEVFRKHKVRDTFKELSEGSIAEVQQNGTVFCMVFKQDYTHSDIVHECVHAVGLAYEVCGGDKEMRLGGEVMAYGVQHLFEQVSDALYLLATNRELERMIVKNPKGGWDVKSQSGKQLGHHDKKSDAEKQLRAIEASKHSKGKK